MSGFILLNFQDKEHETLLSSITCTVLLVFVISESKEKILEEWRYCNDPNTAPFERVEHANRPVIYGIDFDDTEDGNQLQTSGKALYKLLLQDNDGHVFYAFEIEELPFLHPSVKSTENPLPIPMGGKLELFKGTVVSYGFVLLRRNSCRYQAPNLGSEFSQKLNDGLVQKYIEMLERQLHGDKGSNPR